MQFSFIAAERVFVYYYYYEIIVCLCSQMSCMTNTSFWRKSFLEILCFSHDKLARYSHLFVSVHCCWLWFDGEPDDVLFIAGLVAYWPARIHDVALLDLYCPHVTSGRLAVCYSQRRSIFSSATAFMTAKLRWQQLRYRTVNGKKLKPAIMWA